MVLPLIDWLVLVVYFAAMMGVGVYFYRSGRSDTAEGFTKADGGMPGWVVGLSILATYLSSISFLALPGRAYVGNWNAFVFSLSLPLALWVAARWFVPYYRATGDVSAYSHLETRFGPWARMYAGVCYLLTQLARMGAVMYLMALPLHLLLGWEMHWVILLTGVSVIFYTMLGGIVVVMWSDAIQALILMAGALLCLVLLLTGLPEGAVQGFRLAMEQDKFSLGCFGGSLADSTFWVVLVYGLVINLQNFGIDQNYVQRYVAARSETAARRSLWLGGLLYVPVSAMFFLIGTALFVFYATQPGLLPADLKADGTVDRIFPYFIITQLPPGVRGLLLAAIFAAAMSTLSTSLNSSATLVLTDWYQRFLQPECTPSQSMRVLHGTSLVWGLLGTVVALAMIGVKAALDVWWTLSGIFAGGMLGLFLLGLISRRAGNPSAVVGVVAGVGAILWMTLSPGAAIWPEAWQNPMHSFLTVVVGTIVILCVGLLVSSWGGRKAGVHRR